VVLALAHIVAPLGNLLVNAIWARIPFVHYIYLFFQPINFSRQWPHLVIPILAGLAIYLCRKWSFWFYLLCMLSLFVASFIGYEQRRGAVSLIGLFLIYLINVGVVAYFLIPTVRRVYMDPRLRWWQTKPRYRADIPARFRDVGDAEDFLLGQINNFSEGGMFMSSPTIPGDQKLIEIQFSYNETAYTCRGQVIHHRHREGFGVRFLKDDTSTSQAAREITRSLKERGNLMQTPSFLEDSFMFWLKKVARTRKGLLPEYVKKTESG
jgi:hypothetical protein